MAFCDCPNCKQAREDAMDDMMGVAHKLYDEVIKPRMAKSTSSDDADEIVCAITDALGAAAGIMPDAAMQQLYELPSPSNMVH